MPRSKRTPEGWEKQRAWSREHKRKLRMDPEYRAKEAAKALERYHLDKEKHRARSREWLSKNKEFVSEQRKRRREQNPDLTRSLDRKWRANTIRATIAKFRRGDIGIDELDRRLRETFVRIDERLRWNRRKSDV